MKELKIAMAEGTSIEVKRFYLNGVSFTRQCPKCKKPCHFDGNEHEYLSYPVIGKKEDLSVLCEHCDDWFEIPVKLEITVIINL